MHSGCSDAEIQSGLVDRGIDIGTGALWRLLAFNIRSGCSIARQNATMRSSEGRQAIDSWAMEIRMAHRDCRARAAMRTPRLRQWNTSRAAGRNSA